jgi:hypothetical protein
MTTTVVVRGGLYTITPAANLDPGDLRALLRAKEHRDRDHELRAIAHIQVPGVPDGVLASLGHDELVRIEAACDRATLRDVQGAVTAASAAANESGDEQARERMARARQDVADVAAQVEKRNA